MFCIHHFQSLPSTQDVAKSFIQDHGVVDKTVIIADDQKHGYGRQNRTWTGGQNNLFLSMIIAPDKPSYEWSQLSLVTGVALAAACNHMNKSVSLKWPNDVLLAQKKCGGILIEIIDNHAVVGVGVNTQTAPDNASCLQIDTNRFLYSFIDHFERMHDAWHKPDGWNMIREQWERNTIQIGSRISVTINGTKQEVVYNGVTSDGFLRYIDSNGLEQTERHAS